MILININNINHKNTLKFHLIFNIKLLLLFNNCRYTYTDLDTVYYIFYYLLFYVQVLLSEIF
jgi:hypothetical protein